MGAIGLRDDREPFDVPDEAYEDVTFAGWPQEPGQGGKVTPLSERDINRMRPGVSGASSGVLKSKAIATGHKRFHEWKLRRKGSLGATPLRQNLSEQRLAEMTQQTAASENQTFSTESGEQLEQECSSSYRVSDAQVGHCQASTASSHSTAPHTAGHAASLDHHLCTDPCNTQAEECFDQSTPVKWTFPLPVWPITLEVAIGIRRTATNPLQLPPRLCDPENPSEAFSQPLVEPMEPEQAASEALAELIPHLKELFDWSLEVGDDESLPTQPVRQEQSISCPTDRLLSAAAARLSHWKAG